MPFLRLVREILQQEHAFHLIQASAVLALQEAAKSYLIWLMEDTNLCNDSCKPSNHIAPRYAAGAVHKGRNPQVNILHKN